MFLGWQSDRSQSCTCKTNTRRWRDQFYEGRGRSRALCAKLFTKWYSLTASSPHPDSLENICRVTCKVKRTKYLYRAWNALAPRTRSQTLLMLDRFPLAKGWNRRREHPARLSHHRRRTALCDCWHHGTASKVTSESELCSWYFTRILSSTRAEISDRQIGAIIQYIYKITVCKVLNVRRGGML